MTHVLFTNGYVLPVGAPNASRDLFGDLMFDGCRAAFPSGGAANTDQRSLWVCVCGCKDWELGMHGPSCAQCGVFAGDYMAMFR